MNESKRFSLEEARSIGAFLGINWRHVDVEQFRMGLDMELEYVTGAPATGVTDIDMNLAGKISLAHLKEFPNYYARLATREAEAEKRRSPEREYA